MQNNQGISVTGGTRAKGGNSSFFGAIDRWTVLIYLMLIISGWLNIYSAVYNEAHHSIFDVSQRYGMQLIWMGISVVIGLIILLIDSKFYHIYAYPLYWVMIVVLLAVAVLGKEVNGARAWISIGPIALQPTELAKFTTSLALARYMSNFRFSFNRFSSLWRVLGIVGLPMAIIIFQNDTGSALVYCSFLFMFYREGLWSWIYWLLAFVIMLFVSSFLLNEVTLVILLVVICVVGEALQSRQWRSRIGYLAAVTLMSLAIYVGFNLLSGSHLSYYYSILISLGLSLVVVGLYAFRQRIRSIFYFIALFMGMLLFTSIIDYGFDNILKTHQQKRILNLLGIESDLSGWGYNVNQSKITIGSGGLFGKGYLSGTQTKYDFVPEQSTDFIFCTIGEEWGLVGSIFIVGLFILLILRLMKMGERQREPFGRIYCYSVASIFLAHLLINIGMTIGLMPVVGIPLPFFSYGGSSLIAFTILLFVAVKLDAGKKESLII